MLQKADDTAPAPVLLDCPDRARRRSEDPRGSVASSEGNRLDDLDLPGKRGRAHRVASSDGSGRSWRRVRRAAPERSAASATAAATTAATSRLKTLGTM